MTVENFLHRALSARQTSTLYWLGKGGWTAQEQRSGPTPTGPGRRIDLAQELVRARRERPAVHAAYGAELDQLGMPMDALPTLACDCSGFVCWALGVPRDDAPLPGGWINTDAMFADALGKQTLFGPVQGPATPGCLLVYPKPSNARRAGQPGHVGIITAVDATGRVTQVLHCAPANFKIAPADGLPRNAIAETDTALFDEDPRTLVVAWRQHQG
jgi:hypothetical protein